MKLIYYVLTHGSPVFLDDRLLISLPAALLRSAFLC